MSNNRLIHVILVFMILCGAPSLVYGEFPAESANEQKLEDINTKIEKNKREIWKKKKKKKSAQRNLSKLNRELKYLNRKIVNTKSKLKKAQRAAAVTRHNLAEVQASYDKKQALLTDRLKHYHQAQLTGASQFWIFYDTIDDIGDQSYMFEKLLKSDVELIESLKASKLALEAERQRLQQQSNRIAALEASIVQKENKVSKKSKQQKRYIRSLQAQIRKIERQNRELEESSQEIAAYIRKQSKGSRKYYGSGRYIKPTKGWLSSRFGYRYHPIFKKRSRHNGIDLAAPRGTRIRAADSGVVIVAGRKRKYRGYGKVTVIDHGRHPKTGKRISTVYAHQSRILIKEGDYVIKGDEIGWVGSTGYSTGPHLHFELRENGRPVDPLKYLKL